MVAGVAAQANRRARTRETVKGTRTACESVSLGISALRTDIVASAVDSVRVVEWTAVGLDNHKYAFYVVKVVSNFDSGVRGDKCGKFKHAFRYCKCSQSDHSVEVEYDAGLSCKLTGIFFSSREGCVVGFVGFEIVVAHPNEVSLPYVS